MRRFASLLLVAAFIPPASGSTIRVAIAGTTSGVNVDEGPIFGYNSYTHIPDGTPFLLIYMFDDGKGKEVLVEATGDALAESGIESTASMSPGTNATLQIGAANWEFGTSARSLAKLNTSAGNKQYELTFETSSRGNRVSTRIQPTAHGFWPSGADWRASFTATSLVNTAGEFSADNGRVSAKGKLIPLSLTVSGVDVAGQWLSYTTVAGGAASSTWKRQWHLARPSPKGGYVVQEVSRTVVGSPTEGSGIRSTSVRYWEAWKIPPQAITATDAIDRLEATTPSSATSLGPLTARFEVASRFYEGLDLPASFSRGGSPYASSQLSSPIDPQLKTKRATLPVMATATLHD